MSQSTRGTDKASGLWWWDVDLDEGLAYIRRSRHSYDYGDPKTLSARRTVELHPETVRLLRAIQPVKIEPNTPVFVNTAGTPVEPKNFSEHWYRWLCALGLRVRGLYTTKDTAVTTALRRGVRIEWLEAQTGVAYATLRKHYARWWPAEDRADLRLFVSTPETADGTADGMTGEPVICPRFERSAPGRSKNAKQIATSGVRGGRLEPPADEGKPSKIKRR